MPSPPDSAGQHDFHRQLETIWEDPRIRRLARSRAGDPELAADALQDTYCAVASLRDYTGIDDLHKYFCRVLLNRLYRLRQTRVDPVENVEDLVGTGKGNAGRPPPEPFDEALCNNLLARNWLRHLMANRGSFAREVPGRSPDPCRYRAVIVACAEDLLVAMMTSDISDADSNQALRASYPAWFDEEGCETANAHQRFKRARDDVRALLRLIIHREDLCP